MEEKLPGTRESQRLEDARENLENKYIKSAAYLVAICGVLMHAYLTAVHTMSGSIYYYLIPAMNVIPYLVCLFITASSTRPAMPLCAALMVLSFDLYLFQDYFFSERTYRFQIIESFQILLKIVIIVPVGCLVGYLADRLMHGIIKRV